MKKKQSYNPLIHHRRSIRLKNYDYSQAGFYFITICCQDGIGYFGDIQNGNLILNDAGKMIEYWYFQIEKKYLDIQCLEMIVMPNHFHCIFQNIGTEKIISPLSQIIQWFKTMTTNEYIRGVKNLLWPPFHSKLWQRNYHEHIIRHEKAYQNIATYIINNPLLWEKDKFYTIKKIS